MAGISFLFWNVNGQPLRERVARLAAAHSADVVIVAACAMPSAAVSRALNDATGDTFRVVPGSGDGLRLFTRTPLAGWRFATQEAFESWLGFRVSVHPLPELILFAAHLPSKLRTTERDRELVASNLATDVRLLEERCGHSRAVVVGDLNVNPFEAPVVAANGLHAMMTAALTGREARTVRGREYPLMYNPMWGVLGDRTPGPAGTYYRASSESVNYFWNTYDQVLLRPALIPHLSAVRVIDSDGTDSLLTANGLPDTASGSDHLPLFFRLDW